MPGKHDVSLQPKTAKGTKFPITLTSHQREALVSCTRLKAGMVILLNLHCFLCLTRSMRGFIWGCQKTRMRIAS